MPGSVGWNLTWLRCFGVSNRHLTNVQIREAMDATALDLGDAGRDVHYGYGLVQAYDALKYLQKAGKGPKGPKP